MYFQCFLRALFDYKAQEDQLHPCSEIGLNFKKGDILQVLNVSDPNWWQAKHFKNENMSGLIPSPELEERRRAFVRSERNKNVICGKMKKIKTMYKSTENNQFDKADFIPYQEVIIMPPFKRRTLILIGADEVECDNLTNLFVERKSNRFETCQICRFSFKKLFIVLYF